MIQGQAPISYTRQADWFDPAEHPDASVTIVGVGGIGSPTALALAKLGIPRFTLIDPDTVEPHNIPNQMFVPDDASMSKVSAMARELEAYTGEDVSVQTYTARITEAGWLRDGYEPPYALRLRGLVISGLDSMEARRHLWEQAIKHNIYVPRYLDARLGGENVVVYCVNPTVPDDIEYYESTLYTDEEAREDSCTRRSIIDVGFAVASLLTRSVRRHFTGLSVERTVYLDQESLTIMKEAGR